MKDKKGYGEDAQDNNRFRPDGEGKGEFEALTTVGVLTLTDIQ